METTRRSRPHPARRARRITGAIGAGGFVAMAGWFALTTDVSNASTSATTNTSTSDTPAITPATTAPTGRGPRRRSTSPQASPAAPSSRPNTTTRGS